jgi:Cu2+-exporting ATPase
MKCSKGIRPTSTNKEKFRTQNEQMTPHDHQQMTGPHTGHDMTDIHASHDRHAGHSVAMFRDKFWLSLVLTIPVVFWSADVQHWLGYTAPTFPGSKFIPPILARIARAFSEW